MLKGIDISHFSSFTLEQLRSMARTNQLYFNFIKASEGATLKDNRFVEYWQMSRSAGMLNSGYHFFRPLSDAAAQANNFIDQCKKVNLSGSLPPVVDIEWAKSTANGTEQWAQLPVKDRVPKIMKFLLAAEEAFHIKPIIYTAPQFWKEFIQPGLSDQETSTFAGYPLWVVDLKRTGKLPLPWQKAGAVFIQTHFGEHATTTSLYDKTDQDEFPGTVKELLNMTLPGLTFSKGAPFSFFVMDLQEKLRALGNLSDTADGIFGINTENAVKEFQKANGLFENGIADMQTWNKLL